jgi:hypothetical protein
MKNLTKARSTNLIYIVPGKDDTSASFHQPRESGNQNQAGRSRAKQGPRASYSTQTGTSRVSMKCNQIQTDRGRDRDLKHKNPIGQE